MTDRYQIRRDLDLSVDQTIALRMAYNTLTDVVAYARRRRDGGLLYTNARIVARRTREMITAFGERKQ